MAGTFTVTVTDHGGTVVQGVVVKAWDLYGQYGGVATTNASGVAVVSVTAGTYVLHAEEMSTTAYDPQWIGPHGVGVPTMEMAGQFTVADAGNLAVPMRLETDVHMYGEDRGPIGYTFWKDTSNANAIVRLAPGEERRPFSGDKTDPLYNHVLVGPFLTAAAAAAA